MGLFYNILKKASQEGRLSEALTPDAKSESVPVQPEPPSRSGRPLLNREVSFSFDREWIQTFEETALELLDNLIAADIHTVGFVSPHSSSATGNLSTALAFHLLHNPRMLQKYNEDSMPAEQTKPAQRTIGEILLIDANFGGGNIHKVIAAPSEPGVMDFLIGSVDGEQIVQRDPTLKLNFIPIGSTPDTASFAFDISRFNAFLEQSKSHFRFVLISIPACLNYSESLQFCKMCQGVVLVMQKSENHWEVMKKTRDILEGANVKIISGLLLN